MMNLILVALALMSLGIRAANAACMTGRVPAAATPGRLSRSADRKAR
jgi:hypothetical protein